MSDSYDEWCFSYPFNMSPLHLPSPSHFFGLKWRRDSPEYLPACTKSWHFEHKGTCFRFIRANCLSKELSFVLIVLMCFMWCISIFLLVPQFAQGCFNESIVEILQIFISNGSLVFPIALKLFGLRFRVGSLKFKSTTSPLGLLI